jgi:hypothetical protein
MRIAAYKIISLKGSAWYQKSLIRLLRIKMNDTMGLKPSALPLD